MVLYFAFMSISMLLAGPHILFTLCSLLMSLVHTNICLFILCYHICFLTHTVFAFELSRFWRTHNRYTLLFINIFILHLYVALYMALFFAFISIGMLLARTYYTLLFTYILGAHSDFFIYIILFNYYFIFCFHVN